MKKLFLSSVLCLLASIYAKQAIAQILHSESFDANQFLPAGWSAVGNAPDWARVTTLSAPLNGGPHTGAGMARMRFPNNGTGTSVSETIATPVFDLTGRGNNVVPVSFWIYRDSLMPANADSLAVYVNTTASLTGAVSLGVVARNRSINVPDTKAVNGWYQYTFNIPLSFAGSSNFILFNGTAYGPSTTARRVVIDDIEWTEYPPACSGTPTAGTLSAPSTTFCGGQGNTTLTLANAQTGTGISYSWFTSSNQAGPYVALTNTSNSWPTGNLSATQYYYVQVTCGASSLSSNTDTLAIVVNTAPLPVVSISMSNDTICQGDILTLTATGASTYTWSTQQNPTLGTGASIDVNPMFTTTYTLVGTDASGCPSSPVSQAIVVGRKPIINNLLNTNNTLCQGGSTTLSVQATSGVGGPGGGGVTLIYNWSPSGGSTATTTVSPSQTTLYTVTVIGQYGCSTSDTTSVFVDPTLVSPTVNLNQDSIDYCQGTGTAVDLIATSSNANASYNWEANGQPLGQTTSSITITPNNQNTTYTVTVTDPTNGCSASASATIYVHQTPNVNAITTTPTICLNGSGIINAQVFTGPGGSTTGYTFNWTPGNITTQLATVTPSTDTYYTVVVTSPFGCSNLDSVQITIDPTQTSPSLQLAASTTVLCNNNLGPIDLIATTDATNPSYQWTPNFINQNSPNITINPQNNMNISVTVTDQNGCTTATGLSIQVIAPPTANSTWVSAPNNVVDFSNSSLNSTTYFWDFGDGTTSTEINPSHSYPSEGTWTVTLISSNSGCSDTLILNVSSSLVGLQTTDWLISIAPNPVQDLLFIRTNGLVKISLTDITGNTLVDQQEINGQGAVSFNELQSGIYLLKLESGKEEIIKRILKN